ncbi:hypothetical protein M0805_004349 [Coniferiporia weirii]|nr:hypothetical protein M0805_004349 [Coniferiporia weirii]
MTDRLDEQLVSDAFHSYLKSSLSQAKAERLLDTELLSSAEADIMITGPALCLYFAALRCATDPPSVPLPRTGKAFPQVDLTLTNCPQPFVSFLRVWARTVPTIQRLAPTQQHALARIICGRDPAAAVEGEGSKQLPRIAAQLRAVAIEISQRRSFQDRYAADLQTALDAGRAPRPGARRVIAGFVPPPEYEPSPSPSPSPSPTPSPKWPASASFPPPSSPPASTSTFLQLPTSPTAPTFQRSRTPSPARAPPSPMSPSTPLSPSSSSSSSSFADDAPALTLIRETLYASLADVLISHTHVRRLLRRDPPRAYFASVALAVLDVARARTRTYPRMHRDPHAHPSRGGEDDTEVVVTGVLGAPLTLAQCPHALRPFMRELGALGAAVRDAETEDTQRALEALARDAAGALPEPRVERVRRMLERGVGSERGRRRGGDEGGSDDSDDEEDSEEEGEESESARRRSVEGRAIALANRINALALGMTKLRAFRDRQSEVFAILAAVVS